jgi:prevent-host-death family protein
MAKNSAKTKRKTKSKTAQRAAPLAAPKRASAVWSIQDGKDGFSTMVEASQRTPQTVTKHGKRMSVLVAAEEYDRLTAEKGKPAKNFVEHLLSMPQDDGEFERIRFTLRDIEF